jgi:hypothetical protein
MKYNNFKGDLNEKSYNFIYTNEKNCLNKFIKIKGYEITCNILIVVNSELASINLNIKKRMQSVKEKKFSLTISQSIILHQMRINYNNEMENLIKKTSKKNDYFDLLLGCIHSIETKKELIESANTSKEDLEEFINLLTSEQYKNLINFFKTSPKLETTINYRTSDGIERKILLRGLKDFFQ